MSRFQSIPPYSKKLTTWLNWVESYLLPENLIHRQILPSPPVPEIQYERSLLMAELSNSQDAFQSDTITAFAHDLGSVKTATAITFVIGHYHGGAFNYKSNDQTPHFRPEYGNPVSAVVHFIDNYASACPDCGTFESKLHDLAISTSCGKYRNILALTVRQGFGAIEITITSGTNPTNMKDVMVFIKELSQMET